MSFEVERGLSAPFLFRVSCLEHLAFELFQGSLVELVDLDDLRGLAGLLSALGRSDLLL